ncbi:sensor domain-containing diguanylate cyclase [Trabulsiella odontotermitis]|uniref:sensor domain-containing diguanylate cyclase n=1 Tax=Trabulsiella odontotermitis TaxID=379893 RepID=UPI000A5CDDC3|nr:diguanylate cyclase [Trabulsiella odontotermitis]
MLDGESKRLQQQDSDFDTISVVGADGRILSSFPPEHDLVGQVLIAPDSQQGVQERKPAVSNVYKLNSGTLLVYVSQPITDSRGTYLGFISGANYLQKKNMLSALVSNHFHQDDTQVYVVDRNGQMLSHSDTSRVGNKERSAVVKAVVQGNHGAMEVVNSYGVRMLAGYASVPSSGWGVVAQQPKEKTLTALGGLMRQMLMGALPLGLVGLLILWWLANEIVRPLRQLADSAAVIDSTDSVERVQAVRSWYFEAAHIKLALLNGINLIREKINWLNSQAHTDPLTGLLNRRAMEAALVQMSETRRPFAVISMDVDHFKQVNDTFGHDVGDTTLRTLAQLIQLCCRDVDLACREGGEEFTLLLPDTTTADAALVGERLRALVEHTEIETVGHITISLGVASWPHDDEMVVEVMKKADELMYQAKRTGRNRLVASIK